MADSELLTPSRTAPSGRDAPPWGEAETAIAQRYLAATTPGVPIYLQLQNAIIRLVGDGILRPDSQLPPDPFLASATGISLGTVQKALGNLASSGWVRREHGRGTFVAGSRPSVSGLWHFRFHDPDTGAKLPVYSKLIGRHATTGDPVSRRALGADAAGFVEIERLIDIDGRFSCHSRFVLGATRFGRILELPRSAVEGVNLKAILAEEFGSPTLNTREWIRLTSLDADMAERLGAVSGSAALRLEILATTVGGAALSFQVIHVPMTTCPLDISPVRVGWDLSELSA
jgi:GntR family transcriptional regulator